MDSNELETILQQPEGVKLDFKRQYALNRVPPAGIDKQLWTSYINGQWDELVKDVIALTNGNIGTAHQVGRLIIGAGDNVRTDGTRELFDTNHIQLSSQQVMAKVNSACEPPISDLLCEQINLDGKIIQIITILPSPHVHETKRQLIIVKGIFDGQNKLINIKTEKAYTEFTTFVRTGEDIVPASNSMRRALEADKGFELAALNENLKFEFLYNLRYLLGKGKDGVFDPCLFFRNFKKNVTLNSDRQFSLEAKYVKRLIMAAFYWQSAYGKLSTQFLDYAIASGKYLRYNFSQGQYEKTPFLNGLHELQINIINFKSLSAGFDFSTFLDKYNEQSKQDGRMLINGNDIVLITAVLSRQENITKLSAALVSHILGNTSKLENLHLNPSSPIPQEAAKIKEESPTNTEVLDWLSKS
ncbi:MAG TPA: RNA-binding domain-containing protein [Abditibacteriaceae bacterium]|jgi:hypothetical protein